MYVFHGDTPNNGSSAKFTNFPFGGCYEEVGLWVSKITPTSHGPVFTIKQVASMCFQDEMFGICFPDHISLGGNNSEDPLPLWALLEPLCNYMPASLSHQPTQQAWACLHP